MARYRDRETGRFVSKEKWTRSKAHGGTRYVRERIIPAEISAEKKREEKIREQIEREIEEEQEEFEEDEQAEYTGAFDSP